MGLFRRRLMGCVLLGDDQGPVIRRLPAKLLDVRHDLLARMTAVLHPDAIGIIAAFRQCRAYVRQVAVGRNPRLHAIDRQRQTIDLLTWYGAYRPGYPMPGASVSGGASVRF
mgnify:CR=1 FL=1